ncbi:MAG: hypothetical protein KAS32_01180 [Candidatus Peribacteraceae bacterium]|nr:hypothetical protein [Candidatus Peribacteraceae bacterium]
MTEFVDKMVVYYTGLDYSQQRKLLTALQVHNKKPPYFIKFKLDSTGLVKLGKVTAYCKKNDINFKAEKAGKMAVRFRFNGMSERNAVLIGQLTI